MLVAVVERFREEEREGQAKERAKKKVHVVRFRIVQLNCVYPPFKALALTLKGIEKAQRS